DSMWHDDDYLHDMNDIVQEVTGVQYRPWMIFEDGRPWPRDDWELASTYREVTKIMPNVWQWGPLTFAHNTPFLFTFWMQKWWRIREMAQIGREWITGCANHDTLRRGTQVPLESRINTYLGDTLPDIRNAYDNPAAKLFDYAMMPGIPMDFLNASMRAPWGFIRNTDDRYGVKVVSEESLWMHWMIAPEDYKTGDTFNRLKQSGFTDLHELRRFLRVLDNVVRATDYDLPAMVALLNAVDPPFSITNFDVPMLKDIARAFMDDVHDVCNVALYSDNLDAAHTAYNRVLREFRQRRPWLINNLKSSELLDYLHPSEGTALFYGVRQSPDNREKIVFIANMEGAARALVPAELPIPDLTKSGWRPVLSTPGLVIDDDGFNRVLTLADSQGVVFMQEQ
ncbi:MAG: glucosylglycerol hydrolase, partial [Aggregatilineales bacterium]